MTQDTLVTGLLIWQALMLTLIVALELVMWWRR
jgi:hypothetical protein